mgnify:CR=1 FL=1
MAKLKKEIKRLKKEIRRDNEILIMMKHTCELNFNRLCTMRGKLYYRENPLHPKVIQNTEAKPAISLTGIHSAISAFKESILNNVGKMENKIRDGDTKIREMEKTLAKKRVTLEDLKELRKS